MQTTKNPALEHTHSTVWHVVNPISLDNDCYLFKKNLLLFFIQYVLVAFNEHHFPQALA